MEIPLDVVVFAGIFLGVLGRTYFPYLKKTDTKSDLAFNLQYVLTAIVSAAITAILVFNSFVIPSGTAFQIFIASFVFAWGINDVVNSLVK